jgi:hypothetical protein
VRAGLDSIGSGETQMANSCEHSNEDSVSIKDRNTFTTLCFPKRTHEISFLEIESVGLLTEEWSTDKSVLATFTDCREIKLTKRLSQTWLCTAELQFSLESGVAKERECHISEDFK